MYNRHVSFFCILAITAMIATITGCNLLGRSNDSVNTIQSNATTIPNGSANVTFSIKAPEGKSPSIRGDGKVAPTVVVTLTIINTGNDIETTWTLKKNAVVVGTSATVSFQSVPAKSCIAAFSITNGNIGGATEFHGSKDLVDGANDITVVPVGSGDTADNTVEMVKRLIDNPSAVKKATSIFIKEVNDKIKSIDFSQPLAFEDAFNQIINNLKPAGLVSITMDAGKTKFMGTDGATNSWDKTNAILKSADFLDKGFHLTVKPAGIFKIGIGNTAIIYFEDAARAAAVVSINSKSGARIAALTVLGKVSHFLELPDGSILLAGINNGKPFVLNWNGTTDVPLPKDTTTVGIKWFKTYTGTMIPEGIAINKLVSFGAKVLLEMKLNSTQITETFDPSIGPDKALTEYPSISSAISGIAVDPYLEGTEFFYDLNDDKMYQSNEPLSTPTNENGEFIITGVITNAHDIMAKPGSLGTHLGKPFPFKLRTNTDYKDNNGKVIASPMTSVVKYGLDLSKFLAAINTELRTASITISLTEDDLSANPLDGLDIVNVTSLENNDLLKLRAIIAVQQYLSVLKQVEATTATEFDYAITTADFEAPENIQILKALAAIIKNACNVQFIRDAAANINTSVDTGTSGYPSITNDHKTTIKNAIQIKAIDVAKTCVSIANYCSSEMVKAIKANGKNAIDKAFITALTTKTSTVMVPEIGPRYYFQRVKSTLQDPPTITGLSYPGVGDVDTMIWDGIKNNMKFTGANGSIVNFKTVTDMNDFKGIDFSGDGTSSNDFTPIR